MTATQPDSDSGMTRRGVIRRTAIGVGAAATLGATGSGSAAAINLPSRDTILTAAGFAISPPLMGAKYVYDRLTDTGTGEDVNDELADLNADETHTSIYEDGIELQSVDDRVLTAISNVVSGLDRRAYQKGIEKAIERLNAGDTEADVTSKADSAAMKVIETTQKNILDHYEVQGQKLGRLAAEVQSTTDLTLANILAMYENGSKWSTNTILPGQTTATKTLADGTSYTYIPVPYHTGNNDPRAMTISDIVSNVDTVTVEVPAVSTGDQIVAFAFQPYKDLWTEINSIATTVSDEISSWVTGIYSAYQSGDVDLSQLVTADQLAATASEQNDLSNVTADFASLGIPINNRTTLTVEIVSGENSGTIIDGNLAVQNPPTDGFIVGDTYDPASITGPVWLMYDRTTDSGETEGDVYQIESKFKVIDAEGYDGEPVSNVSFEEKTPERYSTDIKELNAQLDQLAEYQQEIQEERDALIEEEATGGGGGFFGDVAAGYSTGVLALGAAGVAWLLSKN